VGEVADVLLEQPVDIGRGPRVVVEIPGVLVADVDEVGQGVTGALQAVALPQGGVLAEDAADRLEVGPAGHRVVAHQQQAAGGEAALGDGEDLVAHLRRHPAEHAVQGDELEFTEVVGQVAEVGGDHAGVCEAAGGDVAVDQRGVFGVDVHADEFAVRVGGGERGERAAEAAAEFEVAEAVGGAWRRHAVERGDVADGHRGHVGVEAGDVGDVGDVAFGCGHAASSWEGAA